MFTRVINYINSEMKELNKLKPNNLRIITVMILTYLKIHKNCSNYACTYILKNMLDRESGALLQDFNFIEAIGEMENVTIFMKNILKEKTEVK